MFNRNPEHENPPTPIKRPTTDLIKVVSKHYERVKQCMINWRQQVPSQPIMPDEKVRLLRARLTFSEVLEKILDGMGVMLHIEVASAAGMGNECFIDPKRIKYSIHPTKKPNLIKWVDGIADLSVVNIGDLVALGLPDDALLKIVDESNLAKYGAPICHLCQASMIESIDQIKGEHGQRLFSCPSNPIHPDVYEGYKHPETGKWEKPSNWEVRFENIFKDFLLQHGTPEGLVQG